MIRRIALAGVAGALVLGGLAATGIGTAGAATPTISLATSANIQCSITAKVKLSPGLKNNWHQSAHTGDANPDVVAIPNTTFSAGGSVSTTAKSSSTSCTGSATDGTATATIVSLKIVLGQGTAAVDNPPTNEPATCAGLLAGSGVGDVPATYNSTVTFKTSGAKMGPTTVTGSQIAPAGLGFGITGGTLTGSIAGGNSKSQANVDGATVAAITQAPATSAAPIPAAPQCEASIKIKTGTKHSAKLKGPKGLKKIAIGPDVLTASPSTICIRKGTTCP